MGQPHVPVLLKPLIRAVAPVGGWLAAGGRGGWEPWLLALPAFAAVAAYAARPWGDLAGFTVAMLIYFSNKHLINQ